MSAPVDGHIPLRYKKDITLTPFTPYWRLVQGPTEPYSWIFFVVAQIAGHHRPIAIVSSAGMPFDEDNLRGSPLVAACHRIITIFKNKSARIAIEGELALANKFYATNSDPPAPIELSQKTTTRMPLLPREIWDRERMIEFPFITACLLQGVAFDPLAGLTWNAYLKPFGTVYRDTLVGWGMVVVDISDLDEIKYGIFGFASAPMKFASSAEEVRRQIRESTNNGFDFEHGGEFRVVDEERPRQVMSATEYLAKKDEVQNEAFNILPEHENVSEMLANVPLVDSAALDLIWPPGFKADNLPSVAGLSIPSKTSLHEQAIRSLIESTLNVDSFDMSIFDYVRNIPNFQGILRRNLLHSSAKFGKARSAGQLIRLAFADKDHLSLEMLDTISTEALSAALKVADMSKIKSISVCIESILDPSTAFVDLINCSEDLTEICFLSKPERVSDVLSTQLFEALATRPPLFSRIKFTFAGAYSAALRKQCWLPSLPELTIPENASNDLSIPVQVAPLDIFPVQQVLVRCQIERFAAGFLLFLRSLSSTQIDGSNQDALVFSFSSTPSSLSDDPLCSVEMSPILTESFSVPYGKVPQMRDLVPGGWTVLVSLEMLPGAAWLFYIRYAFVRTLKKRIVIGSSSWERPGADEFEVVDLERFLEITAPEVDSSFLEERFIDVGEKNNRWYDQAQPPDMKTISVFPKAEAVDMLLEYFDDARKPNEGQGLGL
ncbi:hypothetical protein BKA64DRAFT_744234 [Cadophora sp. MPI-SDFR-AT-0126]|nr:hypothetical protein BKA64DRAFT_744234 [Leotiomycetes sp. MPI-SDFR-AT-0126]